MNQISQPDPIVQSVMGIQKNDGGSYRRCQYVLTADAPEGDLLYHTLTCELLFVSHREKEDMQVRKALISKWFLVPEALDEFRLAKRIKRLRQLVYRAEAKKNAAAPIEGYWILTTTNCNARCFYCHEKGIPQSHMTPQTAEDVVQYIRKNSPTKNIRLMWYGGEPLVNRQVIDQITQSLRQDGFTYRSKMISNGYLFDPPTAKTAATLWHLEDVQITLDGLEQTYNRVKAYHPQGAQSPFYQTLDNIARLLDNGIKVTVRLNIDQYNRQELFQLAHLLIDRFGQFPNFFVYSAPLFEECLGTHHKRDPLQRQQVYQAHYELSKALKAAGVLAPSALPTVLRSELRCIAVSNVRVIFPDGQLAFCHDYTDGVLSGSIYGPEPSAQARVAYTTCLPETRACQTCVRYPQCIRLTKCFNNQCNAELIKEWIWTTQNEMQWAYRDK